MTIEIYQSGKGYKDISEALGLKKHSKSHFLNYHKLIQEHSDNSRSHKRPKDNVEGTASLKVTVQDYPKETLAKNGIHERVVKRKPLPTKKEHWRGSVCYCFVLFSEVYL